MDRKDRTLKKRVFDVIEIGYRGDLYSRAYDYFSAAVVLLNLTVSIMDTFDGLRASFGTAIGVIESLTALFFLVDYVLRVWTARYLYRNETDGKAAARYITSFTGIIDLLSFLPYFLPVFFPAGAVAFRMFRVIRIFRLFRINTYYDSLNVITGVIVSKRQQLLSSVFIILVLMIGSSLCMYSIEHQAQPDVFENAFSGIWWAASTLLTVGYGDIYPITTAGKIFGIFITFLGVGMVAIPTGIISAGFVEQYTHLKDVGDRASESDVRFLRVRITRKDSWSGKMIRDLGFPKGLIVAAVQRGGEILIPRGDLALKENDIVVLGAERFTDMNGTLTLREITLRERHPWNGLKISELDISRQSLIVAVQRGGKVLVPDGSTELKTGDRVMIYTKVRVPDSRIVQV